MPSMVSRRKCVSHEFRHFFVPFLFSQLHAKTEPASIVILKRKRARVRGVSGNPFCGYMYIIISRKHVVCGRACAAPFPPTGPNPLTLLRRFFGSTHTQARCMHECNSWRLVVDSEIPVQEVTKKNKNVDDHSPPPPSRVSVSCVSGTMTPSIAFRIWRTA